MGKLIELPNPRRIRAQACVWLARVDAGLSDHDRKALDDWLASSPRHAEALLEIAKLWDEMDVLEELAALFPLHLYEAGRRSYRPFWQRALPVATVAACTLVAGGVLALLIDLARGPVALVPAVELQSSVQIYETAVGDQSSVRLNDGSLVLLNTDTRIEARYTAEERGVFLLRGEASFNVVPDAARPFRVHAADRIVQAVGTAFNVQIGADNDVEVTVTEGTVRVMLAPSAVPVASIPPLDFEPFEPTVAAGEIVRLDNDLARVEVEVQRLAPEDIEIQLAWQHGVLVFKGEPLSTALREVTRYTTLNFELADPTLGEIRVGGYFRVGDVDGLLVALRENFHIVSRRSGDHIVLAAE
jgi:transmembrane sensor